jgi:hypothetical protein
MKRYAADWCCECNEKKILPQARPRVESAVVGE